MLNIQQQQRFGSHFPGQPGVTQSVPEMMKHLNLNPPTLYLLSYPRLVISLCR